MSSLASAQSAQRDLERQIERQIRIIREKNEEIEALRAELRGARALHAPLIEGEWRWEGGRLFFRTRELALTPKESLIVETLLRRAGHIVPYWPLIESLYPHDNEPEGAKRVVHTLVSRIRDKGPFPIRTFWGRGLLWERRGPSAQIRRQET